MPSQPVSGFDVELGLDDVTCTDCVLKLSVPIQLSNNRINLLRDGQILKQISLVGIDTLLEDDNLLPRHSYSYTVSTGLFENSPPLLVTTLDTTSHEYLWDPPLVVGGSGNNVFYDCQIMNDSLAQAVGIFYLTDSSGRTDPVLYNLASLTNQSWTFGRIPYVYQGTGSLAAIPWIFRLSDTDILYGNSVSWNGQGYQNVDLAIGIFSTSVPNKMWGSPKGFLHLVGNKGLAAYSGDLGSSWSGLATGTTVNLLDVFGSDESNNVWACGYSNDYTASVLLQYVGQTWVATWSRMQSSTPPFGNLLSSVWAFGNSLYVASDLGVFKCIVSQPLQNAKLLLPLSSFPYRIRGSSHNNIVVVGDRGMIWHYNGMTWKLIGRTGLTQTLLSVAVGQNRIVAVGADDSSIPARAIAYLGRK